MRSGDDAVKDERSEPKGILDSIVAASLRSEHGRPRGK
jgi:hypothetical protein